MENLNRALVIAHPSSELGALLWMLAQDAKRDNWDLYMKLLHARYVILQSGLSLSSGDKARTLLKIHKDAAKAVDEYLFGDQAVEVCKCLRQDLCDLMGISSSVCDTEFNADWRKFNLRNHPDKGQTDVAAINDYIHGRKLWGMLQEFKLPSSYRRVQTVHAAMMAWMCAPIAITNRGTFEEELARQRALPHVYVLPFTGEFLRKVAPLERVVGQMYSPVAVAVVFLNELEIIQRREKFSLEMISSIAHVLLPKLPLLTLRKLIPAFWLVNLDTTLFSEFAVNPRLPLHPDFEHSADYIGEWLGFSYKYLSATVSSDLSVDFGLGGMGRLFIYNAHAHDPERRHPRGLSLYDTLPARGADDLDDWMIGEVDDDIHRYMRLEKKTLDKWGAHAPHRCSYEWSEGRRQFPGAAQPGCAGKWFTIWELWVHFCAVHWRHNDLSSMARCHRCGARYPSVEDAILQRYLELSHLVECRKFSRHYLPSWVPEPRNRYPGLIEKLDKYSIPEDVVREIKKTRSFRLTAPVKCIDRKGQEQVVFRITLD